MKFEKEYFHQHVTFFTLCISNTTPTHLAELELTGYADVRIGRETRVETGDERRCVHLRYPACCCCLVEGRARWSIKHSVLTEMRKVSKGTTLLQHIKLYCACIRITLNPSQRLHSSTKCMKWLCYKSPPGYMIEKIS